MVKSATLWTGNFATRDATGALATPSAGPAGVLYVAGVADAAVVTISGTNPYKWSVTLPTLTAGQSVGMYITATVVGVATAGFVQEDIGDTSLASDLAASIDALPTNAELATALGTADDAVLAAVAALPTAASIWAAITAAAANLIADHVLRRTTANVEASANGDTLSARSLYGATARLVHKVSISGSTMTTTRSDDSTALTTAALTTDSSADPTTGIDPAA